MILSRGAGLRRREHTGDVSFAGTFNPIADLDPGPQAVFATMGGLYCDGYVLRLTGDGVYPRGWQLGKSANSGTAADHIVLQNGTVYVGEQPFAAQPSCRRDN